MTTDIERPSSDRPNKSTGRSIHFLSIVPLGALALLVEVLAIVLLLERASLRLQSPAVYLLPILVPLPAIQGIRTSRDVCRELSFVAEADKSHARVAWGLFATVLYSYVALMFVLVAFIDYLHRSAV